MVRGSPNLMRETHSRLGEGALGELGLWAVAQVDQTSWLKCSLTLCCATQDT